MNLDDRALQHLAAFRRHAIAEARLERVHRALVEGPLATGAGVPAAAPVLRRRPWRTWWGASGLVGAVVVGVLAVSRASTPLPATLAAPALTELGTAMPSAPPAIPSTAPALGVPTGAPPRRSGVDPATPRPAITRTRRSPARRAAVTPASSDFAEEVRLLKRARSQHRDGDDAGASATLAAYDARFADHGHLAADRLFLHALVACALAGAQASARWTTELATRHPGHVLLGRAREICS